LPISKNMFGSTTSPINKKYWIIFSLAISKVQ
jgi:hypothetical protein